MSGSSSKPVSTLARYRPAVLVLTALAAGLGIYTVRHQLISSSHPPPNPPEPSNPSLHRSNARRQRRNPSRRQATSANNETFTSIDIENNVSIDYTIQPGEQRHYGLYRYTDNNGSYAVWLAPDQLPSTSRIHTEWGLAGEDARRIRRHMEVALLDSYFAQEMPPGPPIPISSLAIQDLIHKFEAAGQIPSLVVEGAMDKYLNGGLQVHPRRPRSAPSDEPRPTFLWSPDTDRLPPGTPGDLSSALQVFGDIAATAVHEGETIDEAQSTRSIEHGQADDNAPPDDQGLMNLLYRIAEDQAKKEGFVHRGVNCNCCNAMPIRGIRYRCTNCHDYDLCEQCEALQIHDKTHLFYKIRIPAPFLGSPRKPAEVWYPGKPGKAARELSQELKNTLSAKTGVQDRQMDACWEQFQCLAASDYPNDPHGFRIAIDRRSFIECCVPSTTPKPPPPNLVHDRMFSFYDTNNDGLIGFEEFIDGIACIANKGRRLHQRIFRAYDIDNDGYVDRKDFLRMFKGYYALTKELTKQVIIGLDDDTFDEEDAREVITGSQPISSIFSGTIPAGHISNAMSGKSPNRIGDLVIWQGQGVLGTADSEGDAEDPSFPVDSNTLAADRAEFAHFGNVDRKRIWYCRQWPGKVLEYVDSNWPPYWIRSQDVTVALGDGVPKGPVSDPVERSLVLCAGLERLQQEGCARQALRRRVIQRKWEFRDFYMEEIEKPSWIGADGVDDSDPSAYQEGDLYSLRVIILDRLNGTQQLEWLHERLERYVLEKWPNYHDVSDVTAKFESWIRKKCKWHEMAKALAPTRQDIPDAAFIIGVFLKIDFLDKIVMLLRHKDFYAPSDMSSPGPTPKRSRSSSKVRFEYDPEDDEIAHESRPTTSTSSKNIPVGELWGGREIPAPEPDFGREAIFQVTQEGMNELLDPMFRLREDVAIEVIKTRTERLLHRDELARYMRSGNLLTQVIELFRSYQMKWYRSSSHLDTETFAYIDPQSGPLIDWMSRCMDELGRRGAKVENISLGQAESSDTGQVQQVSDAMVELDHLIANEVSGEASFRQSEGESTGQTPECGDGAADAPQEEYPAVAIDLHESVAAFNEADMSIEDSVKEKPLELLLADAGYGFMTSPIKNIGWSSSSSLSSLRRTSWSSADEDKPDPTLPQNRPNTLDEWDAIDGHLAEGNHAALSPPPPLSDRRLLTLALWNIIEEEDRGRGGPGRLDENDYISIMEGEKGQRLGFVGSWIETAAF
ncbi:MAG: hypothetical protein Q9222_004945 [Ikaeria aurantiellina]